MTRVAVHTFVIEPIWKSESAVASTPVARLRIPGGRGLDTFASEDGDRGRGHTVLLAQQVEPVLQGMGLRSDRHDQASLPRGQLVGTV